MLIVCAEAVVERVASANPPTKDGDFRLHAFENQINKKTHVALVRGSFSPSDCGPFGCSSSVFLVS
ncbi:MAG: hypothetical protein JO217_10785 [Acidobacteriaceae bacterium]|nr:hypothetical protein [Acidobacteriaceae bacterium]